MRNTSLTWITLTIAVAHGPSVTNAGDEGAVRIAFSAARAIDTSLEIFSMRPDGSDVRQLTKNLNRADWYARISPDGSRIVYVSTPGGREAIYVMNIDGTEQTRITFNTQPDLVPSWSPDGETIVFMGGTGGPHWAIYTIKPDGSDRTFLAGGDALYAYPCFSPDGAEIVFSSDRLTGTSDSDIFIMNADGSNIRQLTDGPRNERDAQMPVFSPDGTRIVFASVRERLFNSSADIWVMDRDGTNFQRLTSEVRNQLFPYWSPDGSKIAYSSEEFSGVNAEIFIMNADGSGKTRLTDHPREDNHPSFGPAFVHVLVETFTVTRGAHQSGGLPELDHSDDERMVIQERPPFSVLDPSIRLELSGTAPTETIMRVGFVLETSASFDTIPQVVQLYDYVDDEWETVDERFTTQSDAVIEFTELTGAARFVEPATHRVQARIEWPNPGLTLFPGWVVRIDRFVWQINP